MNCYTDSLFEIYYILHIGKHLEESPDERRAVRVRSVGRGDVGGCVGCDVGCGGSDVRRCRDYGSQAVVVAGHDLGAGGGDEAGGGVCQWCGGGEQGGGCGAHRGQQNGGGEKDLTKHTRT